MISQEEFRKAIQNEKWEAISKLSDDEIIDIIIKDEELSAADAALIINKVRDNQEVVTSILIFSGQEIQALKKLIKTIDEKLKEDEIIQKIINKIKSS